MGVKTVWSLFLPALFALAQGNYYHEPKCDGKQVIVHLFEWPWEAVGRECEEFLAPKGFCGVQVSPPTEGIQGTEWWTRYQPVSYQLNSRSGTEEQFKSMVERCNAAGVNVYVDLVINHMTEHSKVGEGNAGSIYNGTFQDYPAVPYMAEHFNQPFCVIENFLDAEQLRKCAYLGLNDLNGENEHVQEMIAQYANKLLDIGVRGFFIDGATFMWPEALHTIQQKWKNEPFVYLDVFNDYVAQRSEYYDLGKVTMYDFGAYFKCASIEGIACLTNITALDALFADDANDLNSLIFIDTHDTQRSTNVPSYKDEFVYKEVVAFMLGYHKGFKRLMSSYYFDNLDQGPPDTPPESHQSGTCGDGWVCEHRWAEMANMVKFANKMAGFGMYNFQHKFDSFGFSRGNKGFFAVGRLDNVKFYTGLPDGEYCDIIQSCSRKIVVSGGIAEINRVNENSPVVAICVNDCN